jgi:methylglyoxal synthase
MTGLKPAGNGVFATRKCAPGRLTDMTKVTGPRVSCRIALIAHDNKKADITEWARFNRTLLAQHELVATGTTGEMLARELRLPVTCLRSGPLGGDQQIGARIAEGDVDPVACNRASADFLISSPLLGREYDRMLPDFSAHTDRDLPDLTRLPG